MCVEVRTTPACHRVGSTRIMRGWLFNVVGEFSPKPPFFLRKYPEIPYLCRIHKAVFRQFTSSPILLRAGLLHPFPIPVDSSTHGRKQLWPQGTVAAAAPGSWSAHSYHSRSKWASVKNQMLRSGSGSGVQGARQWASTVPGSGCPRCPAAGVHGTRRVCRRGRAGTWIGPCSYPHTFQLDFYSSQWVSTTEHS